MKRIAVFPILALLSAGFSGCAKGPAGGVTPIAANRLAVNVTFQQAINPQFYYDFAFDDNGNPADGPQAIIGTTQSTNGVVTGSFTVLVQYVGGQFIAFRRTDLGNGQEQLERASNAFIGVPIASGNTLQFTLDLDAKIDADQTQRLFVPLIQLQKLDVNFVTTSAIIRSPNNLATKSYDALGLPFQLPYQTFDVSGTRTIRNSDTVQEATNDEYVGNIQPQPTNVELAQLDITDFTIDVRRTE